MIRDFKIFSKLNFNSKKVFLFKKLIFFSFVFFILNENIFAQDLNQQESVADIEENANLNTKEKIVQRGRGGQELILPNSFIYDALTCLELEQSIVTFSDQAPISVVELKSYLAQINYEKLSDSGKRQYDRIVRYLNDEGFVINAGVFYIGAEAYLTPEFYYRNEKETPWILDYTKKAPILDVPLKAGISDFFSIFMDVSLSQSYKGRESTDVFMNHIFSYDLADPFITHENYVSAGYTWNDNVGINLKVGVGTQSIGRSLMPSIMLSEYLTDAPYANLRFFSPFFNYNFNVTQLTKLTQFYTHRFEWRFFKKVELSLMEGILPYNHFDFRMLNPLGIYHGMAMFRDFYGEATSYFGAKISVTPIKYLRLYALYSQNEITVPNEARENATEPPGMGLQTGLESYIPIKTGYLHFGAEFYWSTPFMFIKQSPNVSFAKVFNELVSASGDRYQWIGNPYGPDSLALKFVAGFENPEKWSATLSYTYAALGEFAGLKIFKDAGWKYDDLSLSYPEKWVYEEGNIFSAPHGIVEHQNIFALKGTYSPTRFLTVIVQPGYKFIYNYNHEVGNFKSGFELGFATKLDLSKITKSSKKISF